MNSSKKKNCSKKCVNNYKYKNIRTRGFNNSLGTCWYSSVLSILLFSDSIGKEFQKNLFHMSEKEIEDKVEMLKRETEIDFGILKGDELNNIPELLKYIKNRFCNAKCDDINDKLDEEKCNLIHRNTRYNNQKRRYFNGMVLSMKYKGTFLLFNTLTKIILDKTYVIAELKDKKIDNYIGIFVRVYGNIDSHISALIKSNGKYILCNSEQTHYINALKVLKNPLSTFTDKCSFKKFSVYGITPQKEYKVLSENEKALKKIYLDIENGGSSYSFDVLKNYLYNEKEKKAITYAGDTFFMWAIYYNNNHYINEIKKCKNKQYFAYTNYHNHDAILRAIDNNNYDVLKFILTKVTITEYGYNALNKKTPFHFAFEKKNMDIIKLLIEKGSISDNTFATAYMEKRKTIKSCFSKKTPAKRKTLKKKEKAKHKW